jgi:hypothetical protein
MNTTVLTIRPLINKKWLVTTVFAWLVLGLTACSGGGNEGDQASEGSIGVNPGGGSNNSMPTLTITGPADNSQFSSNQTVTLQANASDDEDGDISSNIQWSSDLDGDLGVGRNLEVTLTAGTHTITAYVEDSGNLAAESSISLIVDAPEGVATVMWTPPQENTDNTSLTDLAGFKIYYGTDANQLNQTIVIDDATITSWVIDNLSANTTYFFAVTAYNEQGIESEPSALATKRING